MRRAALYIAIASWLGCFISERTVRNPLISLPLCFVCMVSASIWWRPWYKQIYGISDD